jgi:hypothetical protein
MLSNSLEKLVSLLSDASNTKQFEQVGLVIGNPQTSLIDTHPDTDRWTMTLTSLKLVLSLWKEYKGCGMGILQFLKM